MEMEMLLIRSSWKNSRTNAIKNQAKKQQHSPFRTFLPEIHSSVESLKEECEMLLKEDDCFRALSPRINFEPTTISRPMWTQLRAIERKQRNECSQSRMRIISVNSTGHPETTPPAEQLGRSTRTKIISVAQDSPILCLKKNSQNVPVLFHKRNMHFGSEPIKRRKKLHRRYIPRQKEFGTLVRQLRELLSN